jgi:hypothetical protein
MEGNNVTAWGAVEEINRSAAALRLLAIGYSLLVVRGWANPSFMRRSENRDEAWKREPTAQR